LLGFGKYYGDILSQGEILDPPNLLGKSQGGILDPPDLKDPPDLSRTRTQSRTQIDYSDILVGEETGGMSPQQSVEKLPLFYTAPSKKNQEGFLDCHDISRTKRYANQNKLEDFSFVQKPSPTPYGQHSVAKTLRSSPVFTSTFLSAHTYLQERHKQSLNNEDKSRNARYSAFMQVALKHNFSTLAVAHTAADATENVFTNLFKGSSPWFIFGLTRSIILRPFLWLSRWETKYLCAKYALPINIDKSNSIMLMHSDSKRSTSFLGTQVYDESTLSSSKPFGNCKQNIGNSRLKTKDLVWRQSFVGRHLSKNSSSFYKKKSTTFLQNFITFNLLIAKSFQRSTLKSQSPGTEKGFTLLGKDIRVRERSWGSKISPRDFPSRSWESFENLFYPPDRIDPPNLCRAQMPKNGIFLVTFAFQPNRTLINSKQKSLSLVWFLKKNALICRSATALSTRANDRSKVSTKKQKTDNAYSGYISGIYDLYQLRQSNERNLLRYLLLPFIQFTMFTRSELQNQKRELSTIGRSAIDLALPWFDFIKQMSKNQNKENSVLIEQTVFASTLEKSIARYSSVLSYDCDYYIKVVKSITKLNFYESYSYIIRIFIKMLLLHEYLNA
jgi:hypothetical protein